MRFNIDKILIILFTCLIGFMNVGMSTGLALLLDDQATVKSQLLEYVIIILSTVLINFIMLIIFSGDE